MRIRFAPTALVIIGLVIVVLWVLGYRLVKPPPAKMLPVGGGDKPIIIGDGASIDIFDGGVFTAGNSNATLTAAGKLLAKTSSGSGTLMAAYQEGGATITPMCTGQGDCSIVVQYAADNAPVGSCKDGTPETVCGAVRLTYMASANTVTALSAPNFFPSPAPKAPYRHPGFHVISVQWAQQNSQTGSNSGTVTAPPNAKVHQSTVKMCFLPAGATSDGSCSL